MSSNFMFNPISKRSKANFLSLFWFGNFSTESLQAKLDRLVSSIFQTPLWRSTTTTHTKSLLSGSNFTTTTPMLIAAAVMHILLLLPLTHLWGLCSEA